MIFPELIYSDTRPDISMNRQILSDLRLDSAFSPSVCDVLLQKPSRENIVQRREMFAKLLSDPHSPEKIKKLRTLLEEASGLYSAFTKADSECAACFIFVNLFLAVKKFSDFAMLFSGYGKLFDAFSETFRKFSGESIFPEAENSALQLSEKLSSALSFSVTVSGDLATVSKVCESGIADSLKNCAKLLGIESKEKKTAPVQTYAPVANAIRTLFPDLFTEAKNFTDKYRMAVSGEMFRYTEQLGFIDGVIDFTLHAASNGIPFCFPEISDSKVISLTDLYDVTLLQKDCTHIVPNDVFFDENERFFYLTGANGGGKTTYLRAIGGALLMFLAGMPVFCKSGKISVFSGVYTHFPMDERFEGTGRFLNEKNRVDEIMRAQDGNSVILLNETFSTTGEDKAAFQTKELATKLSESGNFGLYITHQHNAEEILPFLGVIVDETDSNRRTFKIEKKRLPPKSFASDILEKYGLTKSSLESKFSHFFSAF